MARRPPNRSEHARQMGKPMNVAFVLRCDGRREFIEQTIQSVEQHIRAPRFTYGVIVDDSGDTEYASWLDETFPFLECLHHAERLGLGGCFQSALNVVLGTDADYAFLVEDDTPILRDVILAPLADILNTHPSLAQLMFMRPPFNAEEIAAGGVYQLNPSAFTERTNGTDKWVEHDTWFGFQPSLVPRDVIELMATKATNFLELGVTEVLKDAGYHFGYWGGLNDASYCDHVGVTRSQGYRW